MRTDRLVSNKGKLNAVDVAYGRLARLVHDKACVSLLPPRIPLAWELK